MKNLLQKCQLLSIGLVALFCSFGCKEDAKQRIAARPALIAEDIISLEKHEVERNTGDLLRDICYEKVLINCNNPLDKKAVLVIDTHDLSILKGYAKDIDPNYQGHYILGLKFIYMLNPQFTKLKLAFQPLIMKRTTPGSSKADVEYVSDNTVPCYIYNTSLSQFTVVSQASLDSGTNRYKDSIKIVTNFYPNKTCRAFNASTDSTGDINSLIFSFQEIDSLVLGHGSSKLHILNAAEYVRANHINYLKHVLLLGSENLNKDKVKVPFFYQKYGNLSHLCPPSCNTITVNLK